MKKERRLSRIWLILFLVNNFMQISADIWALCNKVLHDDPNESSAVYFQPCYLT